MAYPFNVRVYGLLIEKGCILLSDEQRHDMHFTKFPGGGLLFGEGLAEGLKREFMEECETEIHVLDHFYTTDFFIKSAFDESQVISVYYFVRSTNQPTVPVEDIKHLVGADCVQSFRWMNLDQLKPDDVTFPSDKRVVELLKTVYF